MKFGQLYLTKNGATAQRNKYLKVNLAREKLFVVHAPLLNKYLYNCCVTIIRDTCAYCHIFLGFKMSLVQVY